MKAISVTELDKIAQLKTYAKVYNILFSPQM